MSRKATTRLRAAGASLVLGLTIAQMALGAPSAVLTMPTAPAKGEPEKARVIAAGDATVASQSGAFQYSVPVAVPPGRLGMQPSIGLHYSSQAPIYGGIAAGWTLSGFPEVRHDTSDGRIETDYGLAWAGPLPDRKWVSDLAGGRRLVPVEDVSGPNVEATYRAMHDDGYVQYRRMVSGHPYPWEARKPDGTVIEFGGSDHIDGSGMSGRFPVTKIRDVFGNAVEVHYTGGIDFTPVRIEYTTNEAAGLEAHARVELEYDAPSYCPSSTVPIGARLETALGDGKTYPGAQRLRTIRTLAVRSATASPTSMRVVREIELGYDATVEKCTQRHGPQRQLQRVTERAYAPDGTVIELPAITFEYGPVERELVPQPTNISPLPGAPPGAVVWGQRYREQYRWPTVEATMLDLDTDGYQDRLVMASSADCTYRWQRGTPNGFEAPGTLMQLPKLPWPGSSGGPEGNEQCSLAGQRAFWQTDGDSVCDPIGSYFSYRFLNLIGKDQRPDMVAAFHMDARYFDLTHDQTLVDMGLPLPTCSPGPGECPDVDSGDLGGAVTCNPRTQTCDIDEALIVDVVAKSPREPCGDSLPDGDDEPSQFCIDNPLSQSCWPDAPPPPFDTGGNEAPPCAKGRQPQIACNQYVWYVWKNLGGGNFADQPEIVLSPTPLETDTGNSSVGGSPFGWVSTEHGMRDINGDGYLDIFLDDRSVLLDLDAPGAYWWYVWLGDGDGRFRGFDNATHTPYLWWTPNGARPSKVKAGPGVLTSTGQTVFASLEQQGLYDVNADGLPDWLRLDTDANKIEVYYNNGLGFVEGAINYEHWSAEKISALTSTIAEIANASEYFISAATRLTHVNPIDLDADGRLDLQFRSCIKLDKNNECIWAPRILMGAGGTLTSHPIAQSLWDQIMLREQLEVDEHNWWVVHRMTDYNGDGRDDFLFTDSLHTDDPAAPAMRLIKRVDNGRGQTVDVSYAVHTDPAVVTQSPEDGRATANHTWVVSTLTVSDEWSNTASETSYRYAHPAVTPDWRGRHAFRGFERVEATGPSGAVTATQFDYMTDWSGRQVEQAVYADSAARAADQPHTIAETHWRAYELFDGALSSVHANAQVARTCRAGQTRTECIAEPAGQRATMTSWTPLPATGDRQLYVASNVTEYGNPAPVVDGFVDLAGYVPHAGDNQVERVLSLESTGGRYLARLDEELVRALHTSALVSRTQYEYQGQPVPVLSKRLVGPGTWATAWTARDPDTGVVVAVQKPVHYAESALARTVYELDERKLYVLRATNELGQQSENDYDYGTGTVVETRGPNKKTIWGFDLWDTTRVEIDGLGRPVEQWVYVDSGPGYASRLIKRMTYFDGSSSAPATVTTEALIDSGAWTTSIMKLDGSGRPFEKTTLLGSDGLPDAVEHYGYDDAGNLVSLRVPDPSMETAGSVTYSYTYDGFGRKLAARNPDGSGTDTSYEGLTVRMQDFAPTLDPNEPMALKLMVSDSMGRLVEVHEQLDDASFAVTHYEYDIADRMTVITDAEGNVTELGYDLGGRRDEIVRGDKRWSYGYDLNGNMIREVLPHAAGLEALYTTTTVYDDLDRPTSVLAGSAALASTQQSEYATGLTLYYYDECGTDTGPCYGSSTGLVGKVRAVEQPFTTVNYNYDARGNVTLERRSFALPVSVGGFNDTRTVTHTYTDHGAPKLSDHADNATRVATTFDARGLPRQVTWNRSGQDPVVLADFRRNVAGKVWERDSYSLPPRCTWFSCPGPTAQRRVWRYDGLGRVVTDWVERQQGTLALSLVDYWQTGDVKSLTTHTGQTVDYYYDSRHQVRRANELTSGGEYVQSDLTYGAAGRLTAATVDSQATAPELRRRAVSYRYSADASTPEQIEALEQLDGSGDYATFLFDDQGNVIERSIAGQGTWRMHYDGDGRLRELEQPSGKSEIYYYDYLGARVLALERSGAVPQKLRFWFGADEIHYDGLGNQAATRAHVSAGTPIARIENGDTLRYTFHNGLGHLLAVTSHNGADVASFSYTAFGELYDSSGSTSTFTRRFNGKETDPESGLAYYGFRYYDPVSLTWTRADPLYRFEPDASYAAPRLANLYSFSLNNPLAYVDPDGQKPTFIGWVYRGVDGRGNTTNVYTGSTLQRLTKRINKGHHMASHLFGKTTKVYVMKVYADVKPRYWKGESMRTAKARALHAFEAKMIGEHANAPGSLNTGNPHQNPSADIKRHSVRGRGGWELFMKGGAMLSVATIPLDAYFLVKGLGGTTTKFHVGHPTDRWGRYTLHRLGKDAVYKVYDDGGVSYVYTDPHIVKFLIGVSEQAAEREKKRWRDSDEGRFQLCIASGKSCPI